MASIGAGSKRKGSGYELALAKKLAKWSGEQVHRVPQSGAGGATWGSDSRMNGDLVFPVGSKNSFVYEAKKREGWELHHLFLGTGQIKVWWEQVVTDARRMKEHGMAPCLIFSKNRDKDYVLIPYIAGIYIQLDKKFPVSIQSISYDNIRGETQYFDVILTTLEGLTSFDPTFLFDTYRNIDWDKHNKS